MVSLALAFVVTLTFTATESRAVVVNYLGTNYDVTSFEGTYNDSKALLESQVWFGSFAIASDFAALIKTDLGLPGFTVYSPYFAFETNLLETEYTHRAWDIRLNGGLGGVGGQSQATNANWTFATATVSAVPLPAGGVLLLTALAGVAGLRLRKTTAA
jgi:hypothetical protein